MVSTGRKGTFFRRLSRRWDPLVGIDIARDAITVSVPVRTEDAPVSDVVVHVLPGSGEGPAKASDIAAMLRSVLPKHAWRCAIALEPSEILLSSLAKRSGADGWAEKGLDKKEDSLPFDSYGYLTRILEMEARYILAIRNSRFRRYWSVARRAGLDVDALTQRSFSIGMGLEALGVFSRDRKGALVELSTSSTHFSLYSCGFPLEIDTRLDCSVDDVARYLISRIEGLSLAEMPCGVLGGTEELRTMFRGTIETSSSIRCVDVDCLMRSRVIGAAERRDHSFGSGALSSFGLCCIE